VVTQQPPEDPIARIDDVLAQHATGAAYPVPGLPDAMRWRPEPPLAAMLADGALAELRLSRLGELHADAVRPPDLRYGHAICVRCRAAWWVDDSQRWIATNATPQDCDHTIAPRPQGRLGLRDSRSEPVDVFAGITVEADPDLPPNMIEIHGEDTFRLTLDDRNAAQRLADMLAEADAVAQKVTAAAAKLAGDGLAASPMPPWWRVLARARRRAALSELRRIAGTP
jgi:hypothetical protein